MTPETVAPVSPSSRCSSSRSDHDQSPAHNRDTYTFVPRAASSVDAHRRNNPDSCRLDSPAQTFDRPMLPCTKEVWRIGSRLHLRWILQDNCCGACDSP